MYRTIFAVLLSTTVSLSGTATFASQGRGGGPKPKPPTSPVAHGSAGHASTSHTSNQGPKSHAAKPVSPGHGSPKTTHAASTAAAHGNGAAKSHSTTNTHGATNTSDTRTTGPTTATTSIPLTPVQQKLQKNTNLAAKLSSRLPAGTDLMTASEGFRNLGQFVAAVNVSNNLDIPFTQLKSRMVDDNMSLGQSIQDLRPRADSTVEVRRAESDADTLLRTFPETTSTKTKKQKSTTTTKKRG
jgi:hypothetical protein